MLQTRENAQSRSGNIAFGIAIVASLVMLVTSQVLADRIVLLIACVMITILYFGIGTYGHDWVIRRNRPALLGGYFAVMLALGGFVMITGKMSPWLLLLPVVSQAIQDLPRLWGWVVTALIFLIESIPLFLTGSLAVFSSGAFALLAAIVFVVVFTQLMVSEQQARQALSEANRKLRDYAIKVEELATAQERNRLAREIHDGLGHYLTSINIQIKAAQAMLQQDPAQAGTALNNAQTLSQEALADVRRSISALRADPASGKPLPETLNSLAQENRAAGLETVLRVTGEARPLPAQVEFTLFRAAQEGLTNVRKHAQASRAEVLLDYDTCCTGAVTLVLKDDGVGSEAVGGGFGLTGLQERVQLMGGTLAVETAPGKGFTLTVSIPG